MWLLLNGSTVTALSINGLTSFPYHSALGINIPPKGILSALTLIGYQQPSALRLYIKQNNNDSSTRSKGQKPVLLFQDDSLGLTWGRFPLLQGASSGLGFGFVQGYPDSTQCLDNGSPNSEA